MRDLLIKALRAFAQNPRTSKLGIVGAFTVLGTAVKYHFDGDPATVPDWLMTGEAMVGAILLMFFAGDVAPTPPPAPPEDPNAPPPPVRFY